MFPIHLNLGFRVFYFFEGFYFLAAIATACIIGLKRLETAGLAPQVLESSLLWAGMTALQMGLLAFGVLSAVLFLVGDGQPGPALPGSP
jgi:hypothetical protein